MALPFYILHQTFIVAFSYYVNQLPISTALKYFAVIALSLAAIVASYEVIIRRSAPVRVLFGLRANEFAPRRESNPTIVAGAPDTN